MKHILETLGHVVVPSGLTGRRLFQQYPAICRIVAYGENVQYESGTTPFFFSDINTNDKFSRGYACCVAVLLKGSLVHGGNISCLGHIALGSIGSGMDQFVDAFHEVLHTFTSQDFEDEPELIIGGGVHDGLFGLGYDEVVGLISKIAHKERFGLDPIILKPKQSIEFADDFYYDTEYQVLYEHETRIVPLL